VNIVNFAQNIEINMMKKRVKFTTI